MAKKVFMEEKKLFTGKMNPGTKVENNEIIILFGKGNIDGLDTF